MRKKISVWLTLAAILMFGAAVFTITADHYILGALCFAAGTGFTYTADIHRKKEKAEV